MTTISPTSIRTVAWYPGYRQYVTIIANVRVGPYVLGVAQHNGWYFVIHVPSGYVFVVASDLESLIRRLDNWEEYIRATLKDWPYHEGHYAELGPETGREILDWQYRESERLRFGEYKPVPEVAGLTYPAEHYVHLSITKTETDFVAYTPSNEYGLADRQVRLKFGKYLRKAFPDLSDSALQAAVIELRSKLALANEPATLRFATDRETITRIFETPLNACDSQYLSCMYNKFTGPIRPYHVYADSPDVAVAYVTSGGEIIARSVVSTKNKVWIRAYAVDGDSAKCRILIDMLKALGYEHGDLNGNRLTRLGTRGVMLPYLDGDASHVIPYGDYWRVVNSGGEYECDCTDGSATQLGDRCDECDELEDNCECYVCECCESRTRHGCDNCNMCERCEGCITHDGCSCDRCTDCGHLIGNFRHYTTCECDRCSKCGDLVAACECPPHCDECNELESDCTCEPETETEVTSAANLA